MQTKTKRSVKPANNRQAAIPHYSFLIPHFLLSFFLFLFLSCASLKIDTAAYELANREKVSITSLCSTENKLAAISRDGYITIWDLNNGDKVREINTNRTDAVKSMIYTNFSQIVVKYKKDDQNIAVYDANDYVLPINLGPYNDIEQLTTSQDGRSIIFSTIVTSMTDGTVTVTTTEKSSSGTIMSSKKEEVETSITSYSRELRARSMAPDSMSFAITLPRSSTTSISFFAKKEYRDIKSWGLNNRLTSISIDQLNDRIACGFDDGNVVIYNVKNKRQIRSFSSNHGFITDLSFSPDGKYLLVGADRYVSIWDCETWSISREIKTGIHNSLEYSPDGKRFIVNTSDEFIVINSRNGRELDRIASGNLIKSVTFNNNNEIIAIGCKGKSVIVWNNIAGKN